MGDVGITIIQISRSNYDMLEKSSSPFINQIHLQRLKQLCTQYPVKEFCATDIRTLAEQLSCSDRNVTKLIKTLTSIGWLSWKPGKGRGHKSILVINVSFESALLGVLESYCSKGQLSEAARYAEQFGYYDTFRNNLPEWLDKAQEVLKIHNHLAMLVPYCLPELHPLKAIRPISRPYINGLFDTLLRYDKDSDLVKPSLAHHFEFRGTELWLRLRDDVYFHSGEALLPTHVTQCLEYLMSYPHSKQILYRHVKSVRANGRWVVLEMAFADPMILRVLADTHAAIYLEKDGSDIPTGTGVFQLEVHSSVSSSIDKPTYTHWCLTKNPRYFSVNALIDKIECWTIDSTSTDIQAHITHHGYSTTVPSASINKTLSMGCEVMEFIHKDDLLSMDEKAWLINHARDFCENISTNKVPVANCISGLHHDRVVHLYHHTMKKPQRNINVWCADINRGHYVDLIEYWRKKGADITVLSYQDSDYADIALGIYAAQDDYVLNYYKWFLCSDAFDYCLSPEQQKAIISFVDNLLEHSTDLHHLIEELHRCEDWMVQQGISIPLWRTSTAYNFSETIKGTDIDSMGLISFKKLWIKD